MRSETPLAVALDLDGLMFNTEEIYCDVARKMLAARGHELDESLLLAMMGRPARDAFPLMIRHYQLTDTSEQLAHETSLLFQQMLPQTLAPMPGLLDFLRLCDACGLPKAVATSSGRAYVDQVLQLAALPTSFHFLLTAEDVMLGKPHPEIYQRAAAQFGVPVHRMLVLEDSENGCRAAVAAGALAVAVPAAHNRQSRYDGAHLCADSLADPRLWELLG